jgi:hypothetical protein
MVREMLADLARDVPNYVDPDRALAAARTIRRRRRVRVAAAALATVAALVGAAAWWPEPSPRGSLPDGGVASPDARDPRSAAPSPPPLPGGAVGPARLMYRHRCDLPCVREVIVLADGGQYSMDHLGDLNVPSLSPDGRWLVAPFHDGAFALRDLTSDDDNPKRPQGERLSPGAGWEPMTWSPDSRWLLMWSPRDGDTYRYARVDLTDLRTVRFQPPAGTHAIAIMPGGDLLVAPTAWPGATLPLTLRLVDPATGAERPLPPAGAGLTLPAGQTVRHGGPEPALLSPDGSRVVFTVWHGQAVALLEIDLDTGTLVDRYDLPTDAWWYPAAYTAQGILLVRREPNAVGPFEPVEALGQLDPATGHITELTPLPDAFNVLVPGGHTWY